MVHLIDIKGLFVWILGSVIEWTTDLKTKKSHLFRTFQSLRSWPIGSRVITGFLQSLISLGSLISNLLLVLISFAYTSLNPISIEFMCKHKSEKSETYKYVIKHTSISCEWLLQSVTQWLDQLDHQSPFIWVSISRIT